MSLSKWYQRSFQRPWIILNLWDYLISGHNPLIYIQLLHERKLYRRDLVHHFMPLCVKGIYQLFPPVKATRCWSWKHKYAVLCHIGQCIFWALSMVLYRFSSNSITNYTDNSFWVHSLIRSWGFGNANFLVWCMPRGLSSPRRFEQREIEGSPRR